MEHLAQKHCMPCEDGGLGLERRKAETLLANVPEWNMGGERNHLYIFRDFRFKKFRDAMAFVNEVAKMADEENHHPDIFIHGFNKVRLTLLTHAVNGLSENDFILAAKIDALIKRSAE